MLDPKLIRTQFEAIETCLDVRNAPDDMKSGLHRLRSVVARRRELQTETDELRAQRNNLTKQIGPLMKAGKRDEAAPIMSQQKELATRLNLLEEERKTLEQEEADLLLSLPNLLQPDVPNGKSEDDNIEIKTWGEKPTMDFEAVDHVTLGERLGILDFERASKLSGARFPVYVGAGARLERALIEGDMKLADLPGAWNDMMQKLP